MGTTEWWNEPGAIPVPDPLPEPVYSTVTINPVMPDPEPNGSGIDTDCEHEVECTECNGSTNSGCGGHIHKCQSCDECEYEHTCRDCGLDPECDHEWQCSECLGTSTDEDDFDGFDGFDGF